MKGIRRLNEATSYDCSNRGKIYVNGGDTIIFKDHKDYEAVLNFAEHSLILIREKSGDGHSTYFPYFSSMEYRDICLISRDKDIDPFIAIRDSARICFRNVLLDFIDTYPETSRCRMSEHKQAVIKLKSLE